MPETVLVAEAPAFLLGPGSNNARQERRFSGVARVESALRMWNTRHPRRLWERHGALHDEVMDALLVNTAYISTKFFAQFRRLPFSLALDNVDAAAPNEGIIRNLTELSSDLSASFPSFHGPSNSY